MEGYLWYINDAMINTAVPASSQMTSIIVHHSLLRHHISDKGHPTPLDIKSATHDACHDEKADLTRRSNLRRDALDIFCENHCKPAIINSG